MADKKNYKHFILISKCSLFKDLDQRLLHLKRDEARNCLDRVVPSVDVVAHEKVVGVRTPAADPE